MRLLIVEDEKKTSAYLRKGLSENGFVVDVAAEGEDGLFLPQQKCMILSFSMSCCPNVTVGRLFLR
jgi:DNA-binding response OmpR family regulator